MELFIWILSLCVSYAMLGNGEELLAFSVLDNIYRYNTANNKLETILKKAGALACDYDRKLIYYTLKSKRNTLFSMKKDGGDRKIISDKVDPETQYISVDQETGNVYYSSPEGIGYFSYKQNHRKTVISSSNIDEVFDVGFHGKGPNKRVYWSTRNGKLYMSKSNTNTLTKLREDCGSFIILDKGMVCLAFAEETHLARLNGEKTKSLPNTPITPSILNGFCCSGRGYPTHIIQVDGNIYIFREEPKQIIRWNLKTNTTRKLIRKSPQEEIWFSVCLWPDEKNRVSQPTVTEYSNYTIFMVVGIVACFLLLIVIQAVIIRECKKNKTKKRNARNSNETLGHPGTQIQDQNPNESLGDSVIYDYILDNTTARNSNETLEYPGTQENSNEYIVLEND